MHETLEDQVQRMIATRDENAEQEQTEPPKVEPGPEETYHVYPVPGGMIILKEEEAAENVVVATTRTQTQNPSYLTAFAICSLYLLLILATLMFQMWVLFNPPTVIVTLVPKTQQVTLTGTLQLGRYISPITLSQSQIVPTTGKGHQSATSATGYITFYNGQFASVTIAAGTILTGANGIHIITDQTATIPAGNPPSYGQVSVSAHALVSGSKGNIPAYSINQACCAVSVLAKNTTPFTGGQDARDFSTVRQEDIHSVSTAVIPMLRQEMQGAFQGQLKLQEQLFILPCTPTITSDRSIGQEATQIKVTLSETCSAVAYTSQELDEKVTALLSHQAQQKLGTGYSLIGNIQVSVTQASATHTPIPLVFLSFHAQGTWVYALSQKAQEQIKRSIAGKTKQTAVPFLLSLPGIEHAAIHWEGFGDDTSLPKNSQNIHLSLLLLT